MSIAHIIDHSTYTSVHRQEYSTKCYCWYCQLKLDYVCTSLHKKLFLRLVMKCALASHKLYKLKEGKEDFLYYLLDVCNQLIQHAPRFQGPIRPPLDNIARLTGRNHWPAKRESLPNWKKMSSRTKWCRVCYAKGKKWQEESISSLLGSAKDALVNQDFAFQNALNNTTPNLISSIEHWWKSLTSYIKVYSMINVYKNVIWTL